MPSRHSSQSGCELSGSLVLGGDLHQGLTLPRSAASAALVSASSCWSRWWFPVSCRMAAGALLPIPDPAGLIDSCAEGPFPTVSPERLHRQAIHVPVCPVGAGAEIGVLLVILGAPVRRVKK